MIEASTGLRPGLVGSHSVRGPKYVVKKGKTPVEEFSSDVSSDLAPDVPATFSEVVQIGRPRGPNAVPIADYFVDQSLAFPI